MNFWKLCVRNSHFCEDLIQMLVKRRKKGINYIVIKFYALGIKFMLFWHFYVEIMVFYNFLTISKFLRIFLENRNSFFSLLLNISLGLEFQGGIHVQSLVILSKWIVRAADSHPEKNLVFRKFLLLWNEILRSWKICLFSCNVGQFLSVCGNF